MYDTRWQNPQYLNNKRSIALYYKLQRIVLVPDGEVGRCLDPEGNGANPGGGMGEGPIINN
jgi:hypothetical protein